MLTYIIALVAVLVIGWFAKAKLMKPKRSRSKVDAIVISGPSGVGKGTIIKRLMANRPGTFGFCVSHTSRAPREGEVDGVNYHFVAKAKMEQMLAAGEFLECCDVHGNLYGTSRAALADVRKSGKVPIVEIDVQGAQKIRKVQGNSNYFFMFIKPPSQEELQKRIVGRGQDPEEKIKVRLQNAIKEVKFAEENPTFFDKVITNDDLEQSIAHVKRLFKIYCGL